MTCDQCGQPTPDPCLLTFAAEHGGFAQKVVCDGGCLGRFREANPLPDDLFAPLTPRARQRDNVPPVPEPRPIR